MNIIDTTNNVVKPTLKKLLPITVSAMMTTLVVVFLLILPLGTIIDPTGFVAKLGEANDFALPNKPAMEITGKAIVLQAQTAPNSAPTTADQPTTGTMVSSGEILEAQQGMYTLVVPPKQNLQFRFYMERDYDLDYHWKTDGKPLYTELRGQPQTAKDKGFKVFGKLKESKGKGFFIPPFTGTYALYWENKTDKPITVRLMAKGAFKVLG